ncbi:MAG: hypothetical protein Q7W02_16540 [Candidatus Rokubacteria bacterium]|nr:hypothetical protein [Candidatus Rokubacteria bacterium]
MRTLPDEAVEDFFKIAVEALEKADELVRGGMQEARQRHNFYAERRLGLASQREEGAGWTIFRAMLRLNYPGKNAVEVLWEEPYPDGRRADFLFRLRDSSGAMRVAACVELKWGRLPSRRDK